MSTTELPTNTRETWLADRLTGIGASEAAAVLGADPYRSPFAIWAEKTGFAEPEDLSSVEAVEFGVRLERPILEAFADRTGRTVEPWPQYVSVKHPEHPFIRCTPDGTQDAGRKCYSGEPAEIYGLPGGRSGNLEGLVQVKTTSAYNAGDWKDGPPLHYQVQIQQELLVTGHVWGTLVVLIGGQRLRYFDVEANAEFQAALVQRLSDFWDLVQAKTPPAVDGTLATAKILARLHPEDSGETIALPAESADWDAELTAAKAEIAAAEARKLAAENQLKAALGDATFGVLPSGGRWSWKTTERKGYVVEPTSFRQLRRLVK